MCIYVGSDKSHVMWGQVPYCDRPWLLKWLETVLTEGVSREVNLKADVRVAQHTQERGKRVFRKLISGINCAYPVAVVTDLLDLHLSCSLGLCTLLATQHTNAAADEAAQLHASCAFSSLSEPRPAVLAYGLCSSRTGCPSTFQAGSCIAGFGQPFYTTATSKPKMQEFCGLPVLFWQYRESNSGPHTC
jgi:hypothetical protein